jgi:hypothetical protein
MYLAGKNKGVRVRVPLNYQLTTCASSICRLLKGVAKYAQRRIVPVDPCDTANNPFKAPLSFELGVAGHPGQAPALGLPFRVG